MAALLYCLSRIQSSLCCGQRRHDLACEEPWGPEETLRVVKWPLFHNGPSVYTIPPNPLSSFPIGFLSTDLRELNDKQYFRFHWTAQTWLQLACCGLTVAMSGGVWAFCFMFFSVMCLINDFSAPAAESAGQPSSSSSSYGIHRWVSGVWEYLVKPAGSHRTAGHQCTRTGEEAVFWMLNFVAHMQLIKYVKDNILLCNKHSSVQSIKHNLQWFLVTSIFCGQPNIY